MIKLGNYQIYCTDEIYKLKPSHFTEKAFCCGTFFGEMKCNLPAIKEQVLHMWIIVINSQNNKTSTY